MTCGELIKAEIYVFPYCLPAIPTLIPIQSFSHSHTVILSLLSHTAFPIQLHFHSRTFILLFPYSYTSILMQSYCYSHTVTAIIIESYSRSHTGILPSPYSHTAIPILPYRSSCSIRQSNAKHILFSAGSGGCGV